MLNNIRHIYFLGIGGIGMSALARYFLLQGVKVSGYDKTSSELTLQLEQEGMHIHYEDWGSKAIQDVDMVVYTPAVPKNLEEFLAFKESNIPMLKRAKVLGEISKNYFTIAIAGTHGKTTITSMVSHFLNASGVKVNAFIGGIANNYHSNLILDKEAKIMVVEADEFDRSFLHLHPDVAIISSMDADHLDIYSNKDSLQESFFEFAKNIKANGTLILHEGLPTPIGTKAKILRYGLSSQNNIAIEHLSYEGGKQIFEVKFDADSHTYKLTMPGQHNMLNAGAAIGVANILQINYDELSPSVESYLGVKRRFEFRIHTEKQVLIDDYAHHPTEIKAAIAAARQMFPGKKLMGIFQPHLYSRTRDFASDFMAELSKLDVVVLLDIYPARELPIEGVSSQLILDGITNASKFLVSKENICHFVEANRCEVVLIMGAGDIDRLVLPIEKTLQHHA